jgi:hypothetical protein
MARGFTHVPPQVSTWSRAAVDLQCRQDPPLGASEGGRVLASLTSSVVIPSGWAARISRTYLIHLFPLHASSSDIGRAKPRTGTTGHGYCASTSAKRLGKKASGDPQARLQICAHLLCSLAGRLIHSPAGRQICLFRSPAQPSDSGEPAAQSLCPCCPQARSAERRCRVSSSGRGWSGRMLRRTTT